MAKKQFKAESKRLLDLMINSIYTHKEIFLRELISNASDAEDKLAYKALTDDQVPVDRKDLKITIVPDKEMRTLTVSDNGSGFPESVIQEINDPQSSVCAQHHVGINNIKKRMELIYGEGVLYAFFNRDVGSVSEVLIPIDPKALPEKKEKEEDT